MPDPSSSLSTGLSSPLVLGFAITPNDSTDLPYTTRQIRVTGTAGNLAVVWAGRDATGSPIETIEPVAAGDVLDWRIERVKATGTTATGLRGYA